MFSSDWAFGYGKFWLQFLCLHRQVIFEFSIMKSKETKGSIEIVAKCQHCDKKMGKQFISDEEIRRWLECFDKG